MRTHDQIQQEIDDLFKANPWASHPRFPVEDWQYEVRNNDTRQGYATWLYNKFANDEGEPEGFFFCPACRHEWESAKSEDSCPKCGQYVQEGWDV
jgi:hypothetical protein